MRYAKNVTICILLGKIYYRLIPDPEIGEPDIFFLAMSKNWEKYVGEPWGGGILSMYLSDENELRRNGNAIHSNGQNILSRNTPPHSFPHF